MCTFKIIDCGDYITIANKRGKRENHCHITPKTKAENRYDTAYMLIRLMKKKEVPRSKFLRESALRTTIDEKYKEKIRNKMAKDKNKQMYYNVGGGKR